MGRFYTFRAQAAFATAITILELTAAAGKPLRLIRAWVSQVTSETSQQLGVQILRKTATITGSALAAVKHNQNDGAPGVTGKHTASGEGTDGDILLGEGFNALNGWLYLPVPEERIYVLPAGILALKLIEAPTGGTFEVGMTVEEE
jgi:hypothetical protein